MLLLHLTHGPAASGLVTTAGYDLDYRLTSLTLKNGATNVSSLAYAYTDGMNLTGITDNVTAANSNTLGYSLANRLNAASGAWGSKSFGYDGVGNRITDNTTLSGVTTNRTQYYGANDNRLGSVYENVSTQIRSYTYDNAGNTITETRPGESFGYTYNKRNRLSAVTRNSVSYATYGYNALEQLTTRTTTAAGGPVGQVVYTYDLDGHLLTEATAAGVKVREYIWLPSNDNSPVDLPLAVIDVATNTMNFIHADHLGRPIRMTDAAKVTTWQATWKPWGEVQTLSGTNSNNLRFPGQYFQIETGLHYNHHRMYDPVTGRYTQPDPLGFVDGPSVYAYAGNSPSMNVDREGRQFLPSYPEFAVRKIGDYQRSVPVRRWGHQQFPGERNSQLRHCVASCMVAGQSGTGSARTFGAGNELQGLLLHDVPNLQSRIGGNSPWAFQTQDLSSNETGFSCKPKSCMAPIDLALECQRCCQSSFGPKKP
jgi:RHS repeat-associated protein